MGAMMQIMLRLVVVFAVYSALDAQGSTESSPPISPTEGAAFSPLNLGKPSGSNAGLATPPPLASPPPISSPISPEGIVPSLPPDTPAEILPPYSLASPPPTVSSPASSFPPDAPPAIPSVESPRMALAPAPHSLSPISSSSPRIPESSPPSPGHDASAEKPTAPAKAPLHERSMIPVAAPPSHDPQSLPPANNSPAPFTQRSASPPASPSITPFHPPREKPSPAAPPLASRHHHRRSKLVSPAASPHLVSPPSSSLQAPSIPPAPAPESMWRYNAPPLDPGSLILHPPVNPSPFLNVSHTPSPSPVAVTAHPKTPSTKVPSINPKVPLLPKMPAFPPPPPNEDCSGTVCTEPYTNTPPGSHCGCVWPIQVGLRLTIDLYTFFPMVSEFAEEIASSVFMKQSQVRIIGANAATQQPEKTVVLIDLVPMEEKFDDATALLTDQRFWNKQVAINASYFGEYQVLYVRYPGLPPSPPLPPSDVNIISDGPYMGNNNNARTNKPLGVDLPRRQHKHGLSAGLVAVIVLSSIVAVVLCTAICWILLKHRKHSSQQAPTPQALIPSAAKSSGIGGSTLGSGLSSASLSFGSSIATFTGSARTFTASDIEKATDDFNTSRVLGEGGFGRVYSGTLDDGIRVAVKVLKRDDQQGGREFLAEVEMLSRLHHRNLVKLIGICIEERMRCLIYELIPNGSLESHLHGVDKETTPLDWTTRMKIALGAARGLAYLHEDSSPRVIHRDFKSSNILLEHDFTPKVSDFGLARAALDEESQHISTRVMGTFGYVAPEYAMTGHLLVKSDVYSYGVVLLELLTGRKPVDMSQPPGQENLVTWARPFLTSNEGLEILVDPSLGPNVPLDSVTKVAAIASMCVQPEVSHRPFMGEVVQALKLVCAECNEAREGAGSRSSSCVGLSIDLEEAEVTSVGPSTLRGRYSDPNYDSGRETERGLSISELLSTSGWYGQQVSGSIRRHSSSGPLRTGRGQHFWQRMRNLSGGSMSEHGIISRIWRGSH
ncbi:hypothetical protein SAY87_017310 [Trapa incisa]|uniref:Protein kinase domain-containing protein n=1 Tax=Trapa incisa TaxID=236973 RepID=A0AAN7QV83_9MYRT|nr:hypothetical protein SAY87_017310 [Trapa incisa]